MKPFTLYLLHSSHTDVGYTDTQEKMKFHHVAFIREVLELIEHEPRFKWNCESYWCVEQFADSTLPSPVWFVLLAVGLLVLIVLLVILKAWRIANENPVQSIKSE